MQKLNKGRRIKEIKKEKEKANNIAKQEAAKLIQQLVRKEDCSDFASG